MSTDVFIAKAHFQIMQGLLDGMDAEIGAAKNKCGIAAKVRHTVPPRSRPDYAGDPWEIGGSPEAQLYFAAGIALGMVALDKLEAMGL